MLEFIRKSCFLGYWLGGNTTSVFVFTVEEAMEKLIFPLVWDSKLKNSCSDIDFTLDCKSFLVRYNLWKHEH